MSDELLAAIEKVEKAHFRTHQDTGANSNALIVWNALRREAGLPSLGKRDLMQRALDDYRKSAGLALQRGEPERAQQYADAATRVEREMRALPRTVQERPGCFT